MVIITANLKRHPQNFDRILSYVLETNCDEDWILILQECRPVRNSKNYETEVALFQQVLDNYLPMGNIKLTDDRFLKKDNKNKVCILTASHLNVYPQIIEQSKAFPEIDLNRVFGVKIIRNTIPMYVFGIHGLDLQNYRDNDPRRMISEYYIFSCIKSISKLDTCIVIGDFNNLPTAPSLNDSWGLNSKAVNGAFKKMSIIFPKDVYGTRKYEKNFYCPHEWQELDQVYIANPKLVRYSAECLISFAGMSDEILMEVKGSKDRKSTKFDHLPIKLSIGET